jgi:hypothetical protein
VTRKLSVLCAFSCAASGALDARGSKLMPDKKDFVIVSRVTDLGVVEHVTSQRGMLSI